MNRERPVFVGVAGGTASGKTSFARRLAANVGEHSALLLELDAYYRRLTELTVEERARINFDHPDAFDWDLLIHHMEMLAGGGTVDVPVYDYATHDRGDEPRQVSSRPVILVEGILVFWDARVRAHLDIKVFVDADADVRLLRRIRRDINERGRELDAVLDQYETTVRPMHVEFCEPTRVHADVIVPRGGRNRVALDMVGSRLRSLLHG